MLCLRVAFQSWQCPEDKSNMTEATTQEDASLTWHSKEQSSYLSTRSQKTSAIVRQAQGKHKTAQNNSLTKKPKNLELGQEFHTASFVA